jgi:V8-like Glu-specific endopeptidase
MNVWAGGTQRAVAATALAVFLIFAAIPACGASAARNGTWVEPTSARQASEFWTVARMRAAKPLELIRSAPQAQSGKRHGHRGKSHRIAARVGTFGTDFEQVTDPTAPEFRVHGAIFLSMGIFGYGRCSGTAVQSRNLSVVITAGHCLNSGGKRGRWFGGKSVFVPAYRYGQRPFGVFPARWIDTTEQWRANASENFDVGAMVVKRNEAGEKLVDAVGGAGIAWNLKAGQTFDVHGYPAEAPFDGETQRVCRSRPFLGHDANSFLFAGPLNLAVACGLTGGASGGGWTIEAGSTLNGVTDYGYFDQGSPVYGAYFGREVARLYGRAAKVGAR